MNNVLTTVDGHPIVWRDKSGTLHACEGGDIHDRVRLIWTRCATGGPSARPGSLDVPANGAWKQRREDVVDCPDCRAAIAKAETP